MRGEVCLDCFVSAGHPEERTGEVAALEQVEPGRSVGVCAERRRACLRTECVQSAGVGRSVIRRRVNA
jgi:hypothetical protein